MYKEFIQNLAEIVKINLKTYMDGSLIPMENQCKEETCLFGRRVLVIGYGPVGKGIAERARNLGAIVHVTDLDPVRLIEARPRSLGLLEQPEKKRRWPPPDPVCGW